jgi:hypothetical protein
MEFTDDLKNTGDRFAFSAKGHTTFQSTRDEISQVAVPRPMDWSWLSAEFSSAVTGQT